eukprot:scaffold16712_cov65-Phaeocystis_antarctica.AAC.11
MIYQVETTSGSWRPFGLRFNQHTTTTPRVCLAVARPCIFKLLQAYRSFLTPLARQNIALAAKSRRGSSWIGRGDKC